METPLDMKTVQLNFDADPLHRRRTAQQNGL